MIPQGTLKESNMRRFMAFYQVLVQFCCSFLQQNNTDTEILVKQGLTTEKILGEIQVFLLGLLLSLCVSFHFNTFEMYF